MKDVTVPLSSTTRKDPEPITLALGIVAAATGLGSFIMMIGGSFEEKERQIGSLNSSLHKFDKDLDSFFNAISRVTYVLDDEGKLDCDLSLGDNRFFLDANLKVEVDGDRINITKKSIELERTLEDICEKLSANDREAVQDLSSGLRGIFDNIRECNTIRDLLRLCSDIVLRLAKLLEILSDRYGYKIKSTDLRRITEFNEYLFQSYHK